MGFRSYVRQFFAAFFAPSPSFTAMVFPRPGAVVFRGLSAQEPRFGAGQVAQKSSFSMGFRSYVREFFSAFLAPSPSFTAMVFPCPRAVVLRGLSLPKNRALELRHPHFLWVSEVTLGSFSPSFLRLLRPSLPWCFPVWGLWSFKNRVLERDK